MEFLAVVEFTESVTLYNSTNNNRRHHCRNQNHNDIMIVPISAQVIVSGYQRDNLVNMSFIYTKISVPL